MGTWRSHVKAPACPLPCHARALQVVVKTPVFTLGDGLQLIRNGRDLIFHILCADTTAQEHAQNLSGNRSGAVDSGFTAGLNLTETRSINLGGRFGTHQKLGTFRQTTALMHALASTVAYQ